MEAGCSASCRTLRARTDYILSPLRLSRSVERNKANIRLKTIVHGSLYYVSFVYIYLTMYSLYNSNTC
jgi:hypothetical protein